MIQPLPSTSANALSVDDLRSEFPGTMPFQDPGIQGLMNRVMTHGDYAAFQQLFKKMYSPLCQYCMKFVRAREVAEELVSDVFYNIWKNRDRLTIASAKAYLFAAVRNRGYDHLRKIKNASWCDLEEVAELAADGTDTNEALAAAELHATFEQSMARLPKQCKLIFTLSREEGLKYREIAQQLNLSVKTVETQMGRALKHLRDSLPSL